MASVRRRLSEVDDLARMLEAALRGREADLARRLRSQLEDLERELLQLEDERDRYKRALRDSE